MVQWQAFLIPNQTTRVRVLLPLLLTARTVAVGAVTIFTITFFHNSFYLYIHTINNDFK